MSYTEEQLELFWSRAKVEAATAELNWLELAPREIVRTPCLIGVQYNSPLGGAFLRAVALDADFASYLENHNLYLRRCLLIDYPRRHTGMKHLHIFVLGKVKEYLESENLGLFEIVDA